MRSKTQISSASKNEAKTCRAVPWCKLEPLSLGEVLWLQESHCPIEKSVVLGVLVACHDVALPVSSRQIPRCFTTGEVKLLTSRLRRLQSESALYFKLKTHLRIANELGKNCVRSPQSKKELQLKADLFLAVLDVEIYFLRLPLSLSQCLLDPKHPSTKCKTEESSTRASNEWRC